MDCLLILSRQSGLVVQCVIARVPVNPWADPEKASNMLGVVARELVFGLLCPNQQARRNFGFLTYRLTSSGSKCPWLEHGRLACGMGGGPSRKKLNQRGLPPQQEVLFRVRACAAVSCHKEAAQHASFAMS